MGSNFRDRRWGTVGECEEWSRSRARCSAAVHPEVDLQRSRDEAQSLSDGAKLVSERAPVKRLGTARGQRRATQVASRPRQRKAVRTSEKPARSIRSGMVAPSGDASGDTTRSSSRGR